MPRGKSTAAPKEKKQTEAMEGQEGKEELPLHYDVRINSLRPDASIKATASVNINNAFAVKGLKVVEGSNGLFVAMPSYRVGNEYKDIAFPITAQSRRQLQDAVLDAYQNTLVQGQASMERHNGQMQQAPEGQDMQMAGM